MPDNLTNTMQSFEKHLEMLISLMDHLFYRGLDRVGGQTSLTKHQVKCLRFVSTHQVCSIGNLAKGLGISYPATTKAVSRLEEKGLLKRVPALVDRRTTTVEITPYGRQQLVNISPAKYQYLRELMATMPEEKLSALNNSMQDFLCCAAQNPAIVDSVCLNCGSEHEEECPIARLKKECL